MKSTNEKLLKYIYNNIRYPADAKMYGLTGSTRTSFRINKDGSVSDVEVSSGLGQSVKDECIKLVTNMPQWHHGMRNGEKVRVQYNLPIKFKLE